MNEYERMRWHKKVLNRNDAPISAVVRYYEADDLSQMDRYINERERLHHIYCDNPIVEIEKIDIEGIIERILLKNGFTKK